MAVNDEDVGADVIGSSVGGKSVSPLRHFSTDPTIPVTLSQLAPQIVGNFVRLNRRERDGEHYRAILQNREKVKQYATSLQQVALKQMEQRQALVQEANQMQCD